ncbi:MAG: glutamate racemase [Clostridiales bacterium]|jgi:glutamate racemase|nr:glutamate racemase [Clostridiales bacterium]
MDNRPIGFFDSGVGGVTVVKETIRIMDKENIVYFGDTKRVPYGEKTPAQLLEFSKQAIGFLLNKNCKLIVIACNTVSANCLPRLKSIYNNIDIVDVISPVVEEAASTAKHNIGVLATRATVKSRAHEQLIKKARPDLNIFGIACPILVHAVEEGFYDSLIPEIALQKYCEGYWDKNIDTYILGCTHYPVALNAIRNVVGQDKNIIDPAKSTALQIQKLLEMKNILAGNATPGYHFYYSGGSENFTNITKTLLGLKEGQYTFTLQG